MPDPAKNRAAEAVEECWVAFENAGSKRRKFPSQEFRAFVKAARYYIEITNGDPLIHRFASNQSGIASLAQIPQRGNKRIHIRTVVVQR